MESNISETFFFSVKSLNVIGSVVVSGWKLLTKPHFPA